MTYIEALDTLFIMILLILIAAFVAYYYAYEQGYKKGYLEARKTHIQAERRRGKIHWLK